MKFQLNLKILVGLNRFMLVYDGLCLFTEFLLPLIHLYCLKMNFLQPKVCPKLSLVISFTLLLHQSTSEDLQYCTISLFGYFLRFKSGLKWFSWFFNIRIVFSDQKLPCNHRGLRLKYSGRWGTFFLTHRFYFCAHNF